MKINIWYAIPFLALFLIPVQGVFAEQASGFTRYDGDEIVKNSTAQKILQQIELSKKILEDIKSGDVKPKQTEEQKFVEEQRRITKEQLRGQLDRMNKEYEEFTPKNAYAKFVNKLPEEYRALYWDQYNHLNNKIQLAKTAKEQTISTGGTYQQAMSEYYKHAETKRVEMIQMNKDLNIKHNKTDMDLQGHFDANGKLPRYEDMDPQPCFSCKRYEIVAQKMIEGALLKTSNSKILNATRAA